MDTQICPICTGSGLVDEGFYRRTSNTWTSAGGSERCRSCAGRGYVIIPEELGAILKKEEVEGWRSTIEKRLDKLERPGR